MPLQPELQAWRERQLDAVYPIVWLDAIHYKIKENGRFITKAVYTILGLNVGGKKSCWAFTCQNQKVPTTGSAC